MNKKTASGSTSTTASAAASARGADDLLIFKFFFILFEIGVSFVCAWQQMTTTHDSIYGLLQGGTMVPSSATPAQVIAILQGNQGKYNAIGWTISLVTQAVFLSMFLPGGPVHSPTLRKIIIGVFFTLEVVSDLWYSTATGSTVLGAFSWIFNWSNGGWLAALCYIVAMTAGSTLLMLDGFSRFERTIKYLVAK